MSNPERRRQLERFLEIDPDNPALLEDLARESLYAGEHDRALELFERLCEWQGDSAALLNWSGMCYLATGEWAGAASRFARATGLDPNSAELWFNRGYAEIAAGAAENAAVCFHHAVTLDPENARFRYYQIIALENAGDDQSAKQQLDAFLEHDPDSTDAQILNGYFKLAEGAVSEATGIAEELAVKDPDNPGCKKLSAQVALLSMDPERALTVLNPVTAPDREVINLRGYAWLMLHRWERSQREFEAAVALSTDDTEANFGLAWVLMCRDELESARQCLERVLSNEPEHAYAHGLSGLLYASQSLTSRAREFISKSLALDPDNILALLARAVLESDDREKSPSGEALVDAVFNQNPFKMFGWTGKSLPEHVMKSPTASLLAERLGKQPAATDKKS